MPTGRRRIAAASMRATGAIAGTWFTDSARASARQIAGEGVASPGPYWALASTNGVSDELGGCQIELQTGDEVLFASRRLRQARG